MLTIAFLTLFLFDSCSTSPSKEPNVIAFEDFLAKDDYNKTVSLANVYYYNYKRNQWPAMSRMKTKQKGNGRKTSKEVFYAPKDSYQGDSVISNIIIIEYDQSGSLISIIDIKETQETILKPW